MITVTRKTAKVGGISDNLQVFMLAGVIALEHFYIENLSYFQRKQTFSQRP